jgi:hypothetical protein
MYNIRTLLVTHAIMTSGEPVRIHQYLQPFFRHSYKMVKKPYFKSPRSTFFARSFRFRGIEWWNSLDKHEKDIPSKLLFRSAIITSLVYLLDYFVVLVNIFNKYKTFFLC